MSKKVESRATSCNAFTSLPHEFTARLVLNLDATMSARSASAEPTETSRLIVYDDSDRQPGGLRLTEKFWRDHSVWLLEQGYRLRPRFQLDWKPSWEGKDTFWWNYDDGLILSVGYIGFIPESYS
jgi:hypothetical protein